MLPNIPPETLRQILTVIGVVVANAILSNVIWRLVGSKRHRVRTPARVAAAFLGILNLGLAVVCLFRMLRSGPEWMYIALLVVSTVFAYRVGGATRGQYP
jgi:VanZ family protein